MFNWDAFLTRLQAYPRHVHRILPPCPEDRIRFAEKELGKLPTTLEAMLKRFNGARLFIKTGPAVSLFGIATVPPLPPLEWAPDWYIEKLTPAWRAAGSNRQGDWAIAMTNYGGLILLDETETIKEWDTGQCTWLIENMAFGEWIEKEIAEGEEMMAEV
jgi:hypothetical protein